jgi:hypothetical protein
MVLEEGSICFQYTINNGALLQKQWENPTLSVRTLAILPYKIYRDFLAKFCSLRRALHAKLYSGNCWGKEFRATHVWWPYSHQIVAHLQLINQCSFPLECDPTWIWELWEIWHCPKAHLRVSHTVFIFCPFDPFRIWHCVSSCTALARVNRHLVFTLIPSPSSGRPLTGGPPEPLYRTLPCTSDEVWEVWPSNSIQISLDFVILHEYSADYWSAIIIGPSGSI